jgi:hypothetical protein
VFVQLAALASVVFTVSAMPLILWRGPALGGEGNGALELLRWPGLPLVIAAVATYLVASLVNRRIADAVGAARQNQGERSAGRPPASPSSAGRSRL